MALLKWEDKLLSVIKVSFVVINSAKVVIKQLDKLNGRCLN
jgi:hypothetical protein